MTHASTRRCRASQSGSALATVYITLIPVIGMIAAFYSRTTTEMQLHQHRKYEVRAMHRAMAAMEMARNDIINSTYSTGNNDRIWTALNQTGLQGLKPGRSPGKYWCFNQVTGERLERTWGQINSNPDLLEYRHLRTDDLEDDQNGEFDDAEDKVSTYVVNLSGLWHMIESRATMKGISRTASVLVRERDPFTRFSVFIDQHYQGIGGTPKGDIHTNKTLQIFFPDASFDDYVSAKDGFQWLIGASWANTTFNAGYSAPSGAIPMPDLNSIQAIQPHASGPYYVSSSYDNVAIQFRVDGVKISARHISTNTTQTLHDGAYPPSGVIYTEKSITSIKGQINGRVTVATEGAVTITDSLQYVDAQGNTAMVNPTNPSNYIVNPNYTGSSALGIVAYGAVLYSTNVPATLELNAAIFSSQGNVGVPGLVFTSNGAYVSSWNPLFQKQNLCVLGCTIADKRWVGSVVNSAGVVLSGFQDGAIEYDRNLLNNPPPHFLEIERPLFKGLHIVENAVSQ